MRLNVKSTTNLTKRMLDLVYYSEVTDFKSLSLTDVRLSYV